TGPGTGPAPATGPAAPARRRAMRTPRRAAQPPAIGEDRSACGSSLFGRGEALGVASLDRAPGDCCTARQIEKVPCGRSRATNLRPVVPVVGHGNVDVTIGV